MDQPFDKLNRLRKKAGQRPLKSWKASADDLQHQIERLENDGYEDPGPDPIPVEQPPVDFGPDAKADTPPTADEIPSLKDSPLIANPDPEKPVVKHPARLARGTETESHCRKAVADAREKTKKEKKALKENQRFLAGKKPKLTKKQRKAAKKARLQKHKDGTATKTTTAGNKRKLGKELVDKIDKQSKAKHADSRIDKDNFTVAELARECDMDPKVARAKLRRHEDRIKKLHSKGQDRWVFPNTARKTLKEILVPSKK